MSIGSVTGANAYSFIQKAVNNGGTTQTGATGATGGFSDMVASAAQDALGTIKGAETVSAQAITGKASLSDVVTAVNSADVALKSVVAIRDRVISAYQDIMKMPI